jgi:hypothetical protein
MNPMVLTLIGVFLTAQETEARVRRVERNEDIAILSRILEKELLAKYGSNRASQVKVKAMGTYLRDYGVVIDVRLPLKQDPKLAAAAGVKEESLWEKTRQEVQQGAAETAHLDHDTAAEQIRRTTMSLLANQIQWSLNVGTAVSASLQVLSENVKHLRHVKDSSWIVVRLYDRAGGPHEVEPFTIRVKVTDARSGELKLEKVEVLQGED